MGSREDFDLRVKDGLYIDGFLEIFKEWKETMNLLGVNGYKRVGLYVDYYLLYNGMRENRGIRKRVKKSIAKFNDPPESTGFGHHLDESMSVNEQALNDQINDTTTEVANTYELPFNIPIINISNDESQADLKIDSEDIDMESSVNVIEPEEDQRIIVTEIQSSDPPSMPVHNKFICELDMLFSNSQTSIIPKFSSDSQS